MDTLFLLNPGFTDPNIDQEGKKYYCDQCAAVEGVLAYYPKLREQLNIVYVDFPRPRKSIVELIGEENQGCPVLVIGEERGARYQSSTFKEFNGRKYVKTTASIFEYLAAYYGIGEVHP